MTRNDCGKRRMIFTSFGFRAPAVRKKLEGVFDPKGKSVLLIPFAGYDFDVCAENEKRGLTEFGFSAENIFVCRDVSALTLKYDCIYVPGGDTFKLLQNMQTKGLIDPVRYAVENGAVYIGASAGAELACEDLEYVRFFEDVNYPITDFSGLSLIDLVIIPHADQHLISRQVRDAVGDKKNSEILRINNDGVVICERENGVFDVEYI